MLAKELDTVLITKAARLKDKVGNTPLVRIHHLVKNKKIEVYAKQEWKQLSGSVKCRAAFWIINDALQKGELSQDKILLDATSGNTGIAYAAIGAALGIRIALCLPENASQERKHILRSLGANIIYTSRFEGTDGAQQEAKRLAEKYPGKYFYADQYKNNNNWKAHYHTTAVEIISHVPQLTHFVAGLGTSGTLVGTGRRLKEFNPHIRIISLQPDLPLHGLEGWKHMETAIVPKIYDPSVADQNIEVSTDEAYQVLKDAAKYEGLLLSPSSAANLAGTIKLADTIEEGVIVTVLPDDAEKYREVVEKVLM
jgi:cysteine synthase B